MFKRFVVLLAAIPILLCGCGEESSSGYFDEEYPYVQYQHSTWRFDSNNREITVLDGYTLNQGNSYGWVETEQGYDLVLHFVEVE